MLRFQQMNLIWQYFYPFSKAMLKKEEGNKLYKGKCYNEAIKEYSEAIGK